MVDQFERERYLENWQDEIESAYLYRALAEAESQRCGWYYIWHWAIAWRFFGWVTCYHG